MAQWGNVDNAANSVNWAVSQLNKSISTANRTELFGNVTADVYFDNATIGQFGVDTTEQQASQGGPSHAGWVLRTEGSGGRAGRVTYETLVAMGSMSGDDEDTILPDYRIVINTQPQNGSNTTGNSVIFSVSAVSVPVGATLVYSWQENGSDVADGGVYSGNTTATLTISDNTGLDGNEYGVLITIAGSGASALSANATLTET